jgi:hypothetical protein
MDHHNQNAYDAHTLVMCCLQLPSLDGILLSFVIHNDLLSHEKRLPSVSCYEYITVTVLM